jgi:hypothetical protein
LRVATALFAQFFVCPVDGLMLSMAVVFNCFSQGCKFDCKIYKLYFYFADANFTRKFSQEY